MNSTETLLKNGQQSLKTNNFEAAVRYFEQLIDQQPEVAQNHLLLGLAYLLIGQEEAAQLTWAVAFSKIEEEHENKISADLATLLQAKIEDLETQENWELAYLLYQYLHELNTSDVNVILKRIQAAIQGKQLHVEALLNSGLLDALVFQTEQSIPLNTRLLQDVIESVVSWDTGNLAILAWIESLIFYIPDCQKIAVRLSEKVAQFRQQNTYEHSVEMAPAYVELGLRLDRNNSSLKYENVLLFFKTKRFREAALLAENLFFEARTSEEKVLSKGLLIKSLFYIPERWKEAAEELENLLAVLDEFIDEYESKDDFYISPYLLLNSIFYYQYTQDNPWEYRFWQNKLSEFYLKSVQRQTHRLSKIPHFSQFLHNKDSQEKRKLRIGFLSKFMTRHSIGWLSRWIFQHYDKSRFEFYVYFQNPELSTQGISSFSETWFAAPATKACVVSGKPYEIARSIFEDNIDILVDLDSITSETTYAIMALKPAPIQVTWLGYDASGLPTVDYFLVDPLVIPEQADNLYKETLWRLPRTYIAVDQFEVGEPTITRENLNISKDAVIYFSAQAAAKRHPETVAHQIEILKRVPNSYLLLKSIIGDIGSLRETFVKLAEVAGVEGNRLRFLGLDIDEATHRANLGVADVVLDTFPYTGATTTLETLWMGVPLVTRVGQQFSSRNSYAMLRQVGVNAGIAYSADEYIEWGVRFGTDATLREQVRQQLRRSRQTSPLWNAKQFTRDMENAFEQMWQKYTSS